MASLKRSDMRTIDTALAMGSGYVLNFSDRTFAEFFEDEFRISIDDERYKTRGTSKANRLRCFIDQEDEYLVARVLRRLWQERETIPMFRDPRLQVVSHSRFAGHSAMDYATASFITLGSRRREKVQSQFLSLRQLRRSRRFSVQGCYTNGLKE